MCNTKITVKANLATRSKHEFNQFVLTQLKINNESTTNENNKSSKLNNTNKKSRYPIK